MAIEATVLPNGSFMVVCHSRKSKRGMEAKQRLRRKNQASGSDELDLLSGHTQKRQGGNSRHPSFCTFSSHSHGVDSVIPCNSFQMTQLAPARLALKQNRLSLPKEKRDNTGCGRAKVCECPIPKRWNVATVAGTVAKPPLSRTLAISPLAAS